MKSTKPKILLIKNIISQKIEAIIEINFKFGNQLNHYLEKLQNENSKKSNVFVEDNNFDWNEHENQYEIKGKRKNKEYKNNFDEKKKKLLKKKNNLKKEEKIN